MRKQNQTIIFGCNGVLWRSDDLKIVKVVAEKLGFTGYQSENIQKKLLAGRFSILNILKDEVVTKQNIISSFDKLFTKLESFGTSAEQIHDEISNPENNYCEICEGAYSVVTYLYKKGYKLAARSNRSQDVQNVLMRRFNIYNYFDKIVGAEGSYFKPDLRSLDRIILGRDPSEFVMVVSNVRDLQLSCLLGIRCIFIDSNMSKGACPIRYNNSTCFVPDISWVSKIL